MLPGPISRPTKTGRTFCWPGQVLFFVTYKTRYYLVSNPSPYLSPTANCVLSSKARNYSENCFSFPAPSKFWYLQFRSSGKIFNSWQNKQPCGCTDTTCIFSQQSLESLDTARMTEEYSSLHPSESLHGEPGGGTGQPGCPRGRGVKTISSHCATVLITLLVVTGRSPVTTIPSPPPPGNVDIYNLLPVLLLSMEIAGRDTPRVATVQEVEQVTPASEWDAGRHGSIIFHHSIFERFVQSEGII